MSAVTIRDAMTDPALFGGQFGGESFLAWRALLCGFYGLPLSPEELKVWRKITGQRWAPDTAAEELWMAIGRRGGKSNATALLAVYEAAFKDYRDRLAPGEMSTVLVVAVDRKAARAIFRYVTGLLHSNPMLERMIVREDRESVELSNRTIIEVGTASFRSTRGMTYAFACIDEVAFLRSDDSANPDKEIIEAIRPGLATLGGRLVALSSPYARRGELWENYRRHYSKPGEILVAQAASRTMNPTLPQRVVDRAMARDEASAKAEFMGLFRSEIEGFVTREVIDACTVEGRHELPPVSDRTYHAYVDPAGGSGKDAMTLAISHREEETVVVDAIRVAKPPFSPEQVTQDFADLCKSYRCTSVTGDRYAGEFVREPFRKHGLEYHLSDRTASDQFRDLLPLLNSGRVELLDHKQSLSELLNLERRTSRSGKDSISHPVSGHDDAINAVSGAVLLAQGKPQAAGGILIPRRHRERFARHA